MKHSIIAVLVVFLLACVPVATLNATAEPAQAVEVVKCTSLEISTTQVQIKCTAAGIIVLNQTITLPLATVTLPPLPVPTVTIGGPQETSTIEVPVPGPTQTVVVTQAASEAPTVVVTETVAEEVTQESSPTSLPSSTGQVDNEDGTLVPDTAEPDEPLLSIPDIDSPAEAAGLGLLALAILTGLCILFLYLGYIVGYKDSDNANASFMVSMLTRLKDR